MAVGIFALAVTVILALLPALARQSSDSDDMLAALRLPDPVRFELQRMAAVGGFDALAGQAITMASPLPDSLVLAAAHDATRVQALTYQPPPVAGLAEEEQFFLIEVWRFDQGALAFDPGGALLALHVRVSWPYRVPGSNTAIALAERKQVTFNLALNR